MEAERGIELKREEKSGLADWNIIDGMVREVTKTSKSEEKYILMPDDQRLKISLLIHMVFKVTKVR